MYRFPGSDSVSRKFGDDDAGIKLVYPLVSYRDAPPEVEYHSPGAVRTRVAFRAPDDLNGFLGRIIEPEENGDTKPGVKKISRQLENVRTFDVFFTLPREILRDPDAKCEHLLIMLNGLDEIGPWSSALYDLLSVSLAERGIASVLLPTPFHLNRTPQKLEVLQADVDALKKRQAAGIALRPLTHKLERPTDTKRKYNFAPYVNFAQTFDEVDKLTALVRRSGIPVGGPRNPFNAGFYEASFNSKTKVSLFGFSLGGLRALSKFLIEGDENKFH